MKMEKPMPDPGRIAEEGRAIARQSWLLHPALNSLAIPVATNEALASFLPGRVNGPADAYRHIVWVAEMTRRMGPDMGGSLAELHEMQGQASAMRREVMGQGRDAINSAAATAMDRRNNLLGVSIGIQATTFEDVLRLAREAIDRSPRDGSGSVIGAVWLPQDRWIANPSPDPTPWNWPNPDWSRVPRQHVTEYLMGGAEYRSGADHRLLAAERRAALAAEKREAWTLLLEQDEARGGPVQVRAHSREGHPVRAHTRSNP
jgi:hypothetical protein